MKHDFYVEYNDQEIKVEVDCDIGLNGIGHYECHGAKGFDKGEPECDITNHSWNKTGYSAAQISDVEDLIESKKGDWIDEIFYDLADKYDPAAGADEKIDRMRDEGY